MAILEILERGQLDKAELKLRTLEAEEYFRSLLPKSPQTIWLSGLHRFVKTSPWNYWDKETVTQALGILENNLERTVESIQSWDSQISIAFTNLFLPTELHKNEKFIDLKATKHLFTIASQVHPEYLRLLEHCFGNLICVFWGILRKGGVKAKMDLGAAKKLLSDKGYEGLCNGFDDRVRNGIAHGEIHYRADHIAYGAIGSEHEYRKEAPELLADYDSLQRVCNGLAISLLLFGCRNNRFLEGNAKFKWPFGLINHLISAGIKRDGLQVSGLVESDYPLAGSQLHIGLKTIFKKRDVILIDCFRIAKLIKKLSSKAYDRFFFEVDCGDSVTSSVIIKARAFNELLQTNAKLEDFIEVVESRFLWSNEGKWKTRLKVLPYLLRTNIALEFYTRKREMRSAVFGNTEIYTVKNIERQATENLYRLKIKAVVGPNFDESKEKIRSVIEEITRLHAFKPISVKKDPLFKKKRFPARPSYIWVTLYRKDGTLRFLGSQGWKGGNILCESEWIRNAKLPSIGVRNPEETKNGIRYRYQIDQIAYDKAMQDMKELVANTLAKKKTPR